MRMVRAEVVFTGMCNERELTDGYMVVGRMGENSTHFFQKQWKNIHNTLSQFKNLGVTPNQDVNMSE